jgi:hypothetical protein
MFKKILFTLLIFAFSIGGTIAAADECVVDHDALPQYDITVHGPKEILSQMEADNRKVFGTAQDKFDNVFVWYEADPGHRCVLFFNNGVYRILMPEGCVNLYNDGVTAGAFPSASK